MSKGREEEKKENNERWLLTYSDLITLLLALFIMLYTMSTLDMDKYSALAEEMGIVMNPGSGAPASSSSGGEGESEGSMSAEELEALLASAQTSEPSPSPSQAAAAPTSDEVGNNALLMQLQSLIESNGLTGNASVHSEERGIVVSLVEGMLFPSGSADINKSANDVLGKLTTIVLSVNNYIRVEGSTDDVPIHSGKFSSNLELAAQRAINLTELLISQGVDPARISVISYGEYRPVAPNDSDENKRLNRRVDIIFLDKALNMSEAGTDG